MLRTLFTAPLAVLYGLILDVRHKLFDLKILKIEEFDIPVVCVGNLTVGGTGKTPVTEFLIEHLAAHHNVAVLSRGYKRRTKGFVLASLNSSVREIGDEPKQIKLKFPNIPVAVCEKRTEGIHRLREIHPEIDLILLDDAFQHRYAEAWVNVVLMDYNNPIYRDRLLPWGRLRDRRNQLYRANLVVVTKCPTNMNPLDMRIVINSLDLFPYQTLYFTRMHQGTVMPLFPEMAQKTMAPGDPVLAMSGIANPASFQASLARKYKVVDKLAFEDHHMYRMRDMERLAEMLRKAPEDTVIVTTEKDAVKLTNRKKVPVDIQKKLYYVPIKVSFAGNSKTDFLRQMESYVRTNQKYCVLHPE